LKTRWQEKRHAAKQTDKIFTQKRIFDNNADKQTPLKPKRWTTKTCECFENDIANELNFGKST